MCRTHWQNLSLYQRVLLVFLLPGLHKALLWLGFSCHLLFPLSFLPWQWGQHLCFPDPAAAGAQADGQRAPFLGGNGSFFRLWPPAPAPCPRRCSWGLINIKDYKRARSDACGKLQALKAISKQQPLQAWLHELCTELAPVVPEPFKGFIACSAAQARAVLLPSEFCAKY